MEVSDRGRKSRYDDNHPSCAHSAAHARESADAGSFRNELELARFTYLQGEETCLLWHRLHPISQQL